MSSRGYVFTNFQHLDDDWIDMVRNLGAIEYCIIGREICPSTGRRHLQGYIEFRSKRLLSAIRSKLGCHVDIRQGSKFQAAEYCRKDGDIVLELGDPPVDRSAARQQRQVWEDAWNAAKYGRYEEIRVDLRIRHYATFQRIYNEHRPRPNPLIWSPELKTGTLYWGPPGSGKTRKCFQDHHDHYVKGMNHWWDWYADEKYVCIQDVTPDYFKKNSDLILQWTDIYPFAAEYKGGSFKNGIRPDMIIFTSNFDLETLITDIKEDQKDAFRRRFKTVEFFNN